MKKKTCSLGNNNYFKQYLDVSVEYLTACNLQGALSEVFSRHVFICLESEVKMHAGVESEDSCSL